MLGWTESDPRHNPFESFKRSYPMRHPGLSGRSEGSGAFRSPHVRSLAQWVTNERNRARGRVVSGHGSALVGRCAGRRDAPGVHRGGRGADPASATLSSADGDGASRNGRDTWRRPERLGQGASSARDAGGRSSIWKSVRTDPGGADPMVTSCSGSRASTRPVRPLSPQARARPCTGSRAARRLRRDARRSVRPRRPRHWRNAVDDALDARDREQENLIPRLPPRAEHAPARRRVWPAWCVWRARRTSTPDRGWSRLPHPRVPSSPLHRLW